MWIASPARTWPATASWSVATLSLISRFWRRAVAICRVQRRQNQPISGAVEHEVGEAAYLPALVAQHRIVHLGPLVIEVRVAVPREADAPVDLDVLARDEHGRLGDEPLRHRRRAPTALVVDIGRPRRVVRPHPRQLEPV